MSKMLDKLSKILNQAENAGTPEEAETFMAAAMKMAAANSIDLAVARAHQANREKAEEPEERRITINPFNRRHNKKHFMDLALVIADVNDCRSLISGGEFHLIAVGFPSDLDVVEALYAHLAVEMVSECDEALKKGENKAVQKVAKTRRIDLADEDRDWGGWDAKSGRYYDDEFYEEDDLAPSYDRWGNRTWRKPFQPPKYREEYVLDEDGHKIFEEKVVSAVDGRVFRSNFYEAFVQRMKGRLREIKASAEREAGALVESSSTALALRDKKREVDDADEKRRAGVRHLGTYSGAQASYDDTGAGRRAGTRAAETVPVGNEGRRVRGS